YEKIPLLASANLWGDYRITRYRSNLKREWIRLVDRKIGALECPFAQQSFEFKSALLTQLLGNQI
ncbi:hypothetical protein, partial [Xanthomonas citri]|uniref:hypothetical protein n=1 Tax=Xanthomonas citri TaxID=346 RepID=UPI001F3647C1